ncbi:MAG: hypothetical protein LBJ89_00885, partial [Holosporales bacterium]|nr:hypothetical protein [Holosporales bacterium]
MTLRTKLLQSIIWSTFLLESGHSTKEVETLLDKVAPEYGAANANTQITTNALNTIWSTAVNKNVTLCTAYLLAKRPTMKSMITTFETNKFSEIIADEEFATTAFGKIKKIRNLMKCINAQDSLFDFNSKKANIESLGAYSAGNYRQGNTTNNVLSIADFCSAGSGVHEGNIETYSSDPSRDPEVENGTYTYFGRLNALLDTIRSVPIINGPTKDATGEEEKALFALTQVGSRGFDSRLVTEIAKIGTGS